MAPRKREEERERMEGMQIINKHKKKVQEP